MMFLINEDFEMLGKKVYAGKVMEWWNDRGRQKE